MAVVRAEKNSDFTIISNFYLRDKNISLKAKGLLSIILSLPDDWDYSVSGLAAICSEKETAVKSALKELKSYGYLVVVKKMPGETKSGRIEYDYIFYEQPQKQEDKKQGIEILPFEIQEVENKVLEISHNKILKQNTDKLNISSVPSDERDGQLFLTEDNSETWDKSQSDNIITVSVKEAAEHIYSAYPRKEGKAKGFEQVKQLLKGKTVSSIGRVKFNHCQLYCAVREYDMCCEESGRETKFIQLFSTFMNKTVLDYVEKSVQGYEDYMQREYGDGWRSIKFVYK